MAEQERAHPYHTHISGEALTQQGHDQDGHTSMFPGDAETLASLGA